MSAICSFGRRFYSTASPFSALAARSQGPNAEGLKELAQNPKFRLTASESLVTVFAQTFKLKLVYENLDLSKKYRFSTLWNRNFFATLGGPAGLSQLPHEMFISRALEPQERAVVRAVEQAEAYNRRKDKLGSAVPVICQLPHTFPGDLNAHPIIRAFSVKTVA